MSGSQAAAAQGTVSNEWETCGFMSHLTLLLAVCGCAISINLEDAVINLLSCLKVPFGGLIFINQALKQNDDLAEILLHFVI